MEKPKLRKQTKRHIMTRSILRVKDSYAQRLDLKIIMLIFSLTYSIFIYYLAPPYIANIAASYYPTVQGKLEHLGDREISGRSTGDRVHLKSIKVSFQWKDRQYIAQREGENFRASDYRKLLETGKTTVYVNPISPKNSLLSAGLADLTWTVGGLFLLLAIVLSYASVRNLRYILAWYRQKKARESQKK